MQNSSAFATEVNIGVTAMLTAITSDGDRRKSLLRSADVALGRAMNFAEGPDESGMITKLTQHLQDMKEREG